MEDERQVRPGFLPPRAPGVGAGPPRFQPPDISERPGFVTQRMESGPRSPLALSGTIIGSIALLFLVLSAGFAASLTGVMSLVAILFGKLAGQQIRARGVGRAGEARAAVWVGAIGVALAIVAFIVLEASGFTQEELQRWMEQQTEDLQRRSRESSGS